jgi:hypothetical protein
MEDSLKPKEELEHAIQQISLMRNSKDLQQMEGHWKEFLGRLERVWYKAASHFSRSPKWNGWKGKFEQARKTDPLLSYLINARGAEEHTIGEIINREPGSIGINPAVGNSLFIEKMKMQNGVLSISSPHDLRIDFIPGKIRLLPVTNRGRTYDVPRSHLGDIIDPNDIPVIAELAVQFYQKFLDEARNHFVKQKG